MGRSTWALLVVAAAWTVALLGGATGSPAASAAASASASAVAPVVSSGDEWMACQPACSCKWVGGKKTADCARRDFTAVPHGLSAHIQVLDLSKNRIRSLPRASFRSVGLVNVHKISLEGSGLMEVHPEAFEGLAILVELDLSNNNITWLQPKTFQDTQRIRVINLRDNKITSVPNGLFNDLPYLQRVDLSKCELDHVGRTAFANVPTLTELNLSENRLTTLGLDVVQTLSRLTGLVLHANPWRCDCHLRPLRDWAIEKKLYAPPTKCSEPENLGNRQWSDLNSTSFACRPEILAPPDGSVFDAYAGDVTLVCKVSGDPPPKVHWVHNGRVMSNNSLSVYGENRFLVHEGGWDQIRWANLTIRQARSQDRGVFNCVAESPGGVDERSVTMVVGSGGIGGADVGAMAYAWPLVLGLACGAAVLFAILLLLCCFCWKRRQSPVERRVQTKKAHPGETANGSISVRDADEKSLLTVVNPVQKPPRRHESPSAGTEVGDLGRNLLEDPAALAGADEEGRSLDSLAGTTPQRSEDGADRHPPDLLAFGARQHSPTGTSSTGSTAPLGNGGVPYSPGPGSSLYGRSRLDGPPTPCTPSTPTAMQLTSPSSLPSPAAMSPGVMCGTLPYSRSQSPFSPPLGLPTVQSRSGYVTIPRRPRVPSWSSVPTPTPMDDSFHKSALDPIYDNMGPRTTADGSSKLSLVEGNNSRRQIPSHYVVYDVGRPVSVASMASVTSSTPLTNGSSSTIPRAVKVPPKPPPKPKKKTGPLYEDETEDGTEV